MCIRDRVSTQSTWGTLLRHEADIYMGNSAFRKTKVKDKPVKKEEAPPPQVAKKRESAGSFVMKDIKRRSLSSLRGRQRSYVRMNAREMGEGTIETIRLIEPIKIKNNLMSRIEIDPGTPRGEGHETKRFLMKMAEENLEQSRYMTTQSTEPTQETSRGEEQPNRRRSKFLKTIVSNDDEGLDTPKRTIALDPFLEQKRISRLKQLTQIVRKRKTEIKGVPFFRTFVPHSPLTAAPKLPKHKDNTFSPINSATLPTNVRFNTTIGNSGAKDHFLEHEEEDAHQHGKSESKNISRDRLIKAISSGKVGKSRISPVPLDLNARPKEHETLVHLVKNKVRPTDFLLGNLPNDERKRASLRRARPTDWPDAFSKNTPLQSNRAGIWEPALEFVDYDQAKKKKKRLAGIMNILRPLNIKTTRMLNP
eukprot:TRINITY_DN8122_c0_g2_i2.p1 TRINITY_DN8122_c0_g2~~TRINITY_DN8122_c0_g2_i2.p1  ORF type:complete len:421 (+),score=78.91 TRINITY_DN8122_c0_g2_i2:65-1327(+)